MYLSIHHVFHMYQPVTYKYPYTIRALWMGSVCAMELERRTSILWLEYFRIHVLLGKKRCLFFPYSTFYCMPSYVLCSDLLCAA